MIGRLAVGVGRNLEDEVGVPPNPDCLRCRRRCQRRVQSTVDAPASVSSRNTFLPVDFLCKSVALELVSWLSCSPVRLAS